MLPEDNRFEIVLALEAEVGKAGDERLEGEDRRSIGRGFAAGEGAIGFRRRDVDAGGDQKGGESGEVRERIELGAAPESDGCAPEEKERDVAAERGGEFDELFGGERFSEHSGQGEKDGGRVAGAAAKAGAEGDPL